MSAGVPKKEPSYKMGKNIRSLYTEPHADRRPTYNGVWPGSPGEYGVSQDFVNYSQFYHARVGSNK